ncbi:hypothetical protein ACIF9R_09790 [Streptomyces sp. NPDC086080]|uniref:hypothetical protein n=1 Tax=Streptomyces sp. NPDC086080 TaxID=3365748 RepID=UPI0037CD31E1
MAAQPTSRGALSDTDESGTAVPVGVASAPAPSPSQGASARPHRDPTAPAQRSEPPAFTGRPSGPAPDAGTAEDDTPLGTPPSEDDTPLGTPPSEDDTPLGTPPSEDDTPLRTPPSEDIHRRWIAGQVSADDLPGDAPRLPGTETVTLAELRDAGVEITPGMDVEAQLGGGVRGGGLAPLDQVRLLLARPGPWPDALDSVAATVSRRIWHTAFTDFEGTTPNAAQAWRTALGLLLPGEPDAVLADWRYAAEAYRDAVRRLVGLLAAEGTDPRTIARLAARYREILGLPPLGTDTRQPDERSER